MKFVIRLIILISLITLSFIPQKGYGQFFFTENPVIGNQVPDFTLDTLTQKDVNLTEFRQGQSTIVFFWATWCPHCRDQLQVLNANKDDIEAQGIKIVLIDLGEDKKTVERFAQKNNIQYDVFLDVESSLAEPYGLIGVPTFFYVDQSGIVKAVEHSLSENYENILLAEK